MGEGNESGKFWVRNFCEGGISKDLLKMIRDLYEEFWDCIFFEKCVCF